MRGNIAAEPVQTEVGEVARLRIEAVAHDVELWKTVDANVRPSVADSIGRRLDGFAGGRVRVAAEFIFTNLRIVSHVVAISFKVVPKVAQFALDRLSFRAKLAATVNLTNLIADNRGVFRHVGRAHCPADVIDVEVGRQGVVWDCGHRRAAHRGDGGNAVRADVRPGGADLLGLGRSSSA